MIIQLAYALLVALSGSELLFILRKPLCMSGQEKDLKEAATYTIIDRTPDGC